MTDHPFQEALSPRQMEYRRHAASILEEILADVPASQRFYMKDRSSVSLLNAQKFGLDEGNRLGVDFSILYQPAIEPDVMARVLKRQITRAQQAFVLEQWLGRNGIQLPVNDEGVQTVSALDLLRYGVTEERWKSLDARIEVEPPYAELPSTATLTPHERAQVEALIARVEELNPYVEKLQSYTKGLSPIPPRHLLERQERFMEYMISPYVVNPQDDEKTRITRAAQYIDRDMGSLAGFREFARYGQFSPAEKIALEEALLEYMPGGPVTFLDVWEAFEAGTPLGGVKDENSERLQSPRNLMQFMREAINQAMRENPELSSDDCLAIAGREIADELWHYIDFDAAREPDTNRPGIKIFGRTLPFQKADVMNATLLGTLFTGMAMAIGQTVAPTQFDVLAQGMGDTLGGLVDTLLDQSGTIKNVVTAADKVNRVAGAHIVNYMAASQQFNMLVGDITQMLLLGLPDESKTTEAQREAVRMAVQLSATDYADREHLSPSEAAAILARDLRQNLREHSGELREDALSSFGLGFKQVFDEIFGLLVDGGKAIDSAAQGAAKGVKAARNALLSPEMRANGEILAYLAASSVPLLGRMVPGEDKVIERIAQREHDIMLHSAHGVLDCVKAETHQANQQQAAQGDDKTIQITDLMAQHQQAQDSADRIA
jgi:hypothetical protein